MTPPSHLGPAPALLAVVLGLGPAVPGCGDDGSRPVDAAADTALEAAVDAPVDGAADASTCDLDCEPGSSCCLVPGAGPTCVNLMSDAEHCGRCGLACADGYGTRCERGACVCGTVAEGCGGPGSSICCPPRATGGMDYCADLARDGDDCGGCNEQCDVLRADRCVSGSCVCGEVRSLCAGTVEDTCCVDPFGTAGCVDRRTSRAHCGRCGNRCEGAEQCRAGECTIGSQLCSSPCSEDEICCDGECCGRLACTRGACGAGGDGGVLDASSDAALDGGSDGGGT